MNLNISLESFLEQIKEIPIPWIIGGLILLVIGLVILVVLAYNLLADLSRSLV